MPNYERRAFAWDDVEVREDDGVRSLTGYAAVFNRLSEDLGGFRERVAPGAFAKSIKEGDIRALFNHDVNFVLGRTKNNTLSLMEDERGLRVSIKPPDTQWAQDLTRSIKRKDIDQMSFGFRVLRPKDEELETDGEGGMIRTLVEARLFDVSPVTFPAYPQTKISARAHQFARIVEEVETGVTIGELERRLLNQSLETLQRHLGVSAPADNSHPERDDAPADNSHPSESATDLEKHLMSLRRRLRLAEAA